MIDISTETDTSSEDLYRSVSIVCPKCKSKENLKIPKQIINQSKQLTTISIPSKLVCEHSFQAFIDKNFSVRGYQNVDFEISKMEYYEAYGEPLKKETDYKVESDELYPFLQKITELLRQTLNDDVVLGCAIFTINGRILYSSLPVDTLINIIREFEARNEKKLLLVKQLFLVLENDEKICSAFLEIHNEKLIVVLSFAGRMKLGLSNYYLADLIRNIKKIDQP